MYMNILATLALAASALASPAIVLERDLAAINSAIAGITTASNSLSAAVKSFSGAADIPGLTSAGAGLLTAIGDANTKIAASSALSLTDAIGLQSSAGTLTDGANSLVNDIIAKKSTFDAACISGSILEQLQKQKTASEALTKTIISKLPGAVQAIAESASSGVSDAVNKGITAYQGSVNCQAAPASSAAPAPASSAAPADASAAPAASSAAPAAGSSAPAPGGYGGASAAPSASASATASRGPSSSALPSLTPTASRNSTTPTASRAPVATFTGAANVQNVANGFMGAAAFAVAVAVAL